MSYSPTVHITTEFRERVRDWDQGWISLGRENRTDNYGWVREERMGGSNEEGKGRGNKARNTRRYNQNKVLFEGCIETEYSRCFLKFIHI